MKKCPLCGQRYPDDANFCPMDAGRLEADVVAAPPLDPSATVREPLVGGRFKMGAKRADTPGGELYEASDSETGGPVAILLVPPRAFPSPLVADRAQREIKQLLKAQSPRLMRPIDVGRLADGGMFVAMEPVPARSLDALAHAEGPMPIPRAAATIRQIGDGLLEAQKVGVIHRDVAPANVLIGGDGAPCIINFGVGLPVADQERVLGVPEFLSPEQIEGKPVDQRSNIYSLAAMLYFLTTGTTPFSGAPGDVLRGHLSADLEPPGRRHAGLPAALDRLVAKAMEKQPSRRHLTLRQFLGEVEALAPEAPVIAVPPQPVPESPVVREHVPTPIPEPAPQDGLAASIAAAPATVPSMDVPLVEAPVVPRVSTVPAAARIAQPIVAQGVAVASDGRGMDAAKTLMMTEPPVPLAAPPRATPAPEPVVPPLAQPSGTAGQPPAQAKRPMADDPRKDPKKGKFRETMWFKQGEITDAAAAAATSDESAQDKLAAAEAAASDAKVLEDRYKDDGSVAAQERRRYSLRTGHTQMNMQAIKAPQAPVAGPGMSERELAAEMTGAGGIFGKILLVLVAIAILGGILFAVQHFTAKSAPAGGAQAPAQKGN